jgi:hypothetical protein
MLRIRKIFDDVQKRNRLAIEQVRSILAARFQGLGQGRIDRIPTRSAIPLCMTSAPSSMWTRGRVAPSPGFALLSHDPSLSFCFWSTRSSTK